MFADEAGRGWIESTTPMGRAGRSDELDGALLLLASDAGSYLTGGDARRRRGWTAR
ncbi:MAG: hypothetical protein U5R31_02380 [Acidimicrobiia bacterium]|nr:hypothetical protein [Acidimicrobiia bacterium]